MYRCGLAAVLLCACAVPPPEPGAPAAGAAAPATTVRRSSVYPAPVALPGEEIAPGRALVELAAPLPLPPAAGLLAPVAPVAPVAPAVALPMRELGGVPVRLVRSIYSGAALPDEDDT